MVRMLRIIFTILVTSALVTGVYAAQNTVKRVFIPMVRRDGVVPTPSPTPTPPFGPEGPNARWLAGAQPKEFAPRGGDVCWATSAWDLSGKEYKFVVIAWEVPGDNWTLQWAGCTPGLYSYADLVAAWAGLTYGESNGRGSSPYQVIWP